MDILLIEDNEIIAEGLAYAFSKNNFHLVWKKTINQAVTYLNQNNPGLIILDISLPDGNGFNLFENDIKHREIPTIFLTAFDDENDVVKGLNLGAEDYMTKPFSTKELIARVNRILLRQRKKNIIKVKDIQFDLDKMVVYKNNISIEVSSLELKILHLLFTHINTVVRRSTLLDRIWEWTGNDVDDHTVTVYLNRIRDKLKTDIIITVKGIGYRIDEK